MKLVGLKIKAGALGFKELLFSDAVVTGSEDGLSLSSSIVATGGTVEGEQDT